MATLLELVKYSILNFGDAAMYTKQIQEKVKNEKGQWEIRNVIIEMTEEEYQSLIQSAPSIDTLNREERNLRLSECDWTQGEDVPDFIKLPYKEYRQALRDITSRVNWPNLTRDDWPTKPSA